VQHRDHDYDLGSLLHFSTPGLRGIYLAEHQSLLHEASKERGKILEQRFSDCNDTIVWLAPIILKAPSKLSTAGPRSWIWQELVSSVTDLCWRYFWQFSDRTRYLIPDDAMAARISDVFNNVMNDTTRGWRRLAEQAGMSGQTTTDSIWIGAPNAWPSPTQSMKGDFADLMGALSGPAIAGPLYVAKRHIDSWWDAETPLEAYTSFWLAHQALYKGPQRRHRSRNTLTHVRPLTDLDKHERQEQIKVVSTATETPWEQAVSETGLVLD
jgi:hypothetical protein